MHFREISKAILGHLVVIALDQDLLTLQPGKILTVVDPSKIPDNVHKILGSNGAIPVGDERFVHFLDGVKGAAAMPTDVLMTEVEICGEKHIHFRRTLFFTTGVTGSA